MKLMSILSFAGGIVLVVLALTLALTRGVFDLMVFDFYFIVKPLYLMLVAGALFVTGWLTLANPVP